MSEPNHTTYDDDDGYETDDEEVNGEEVNGEEVNDEEVNGEEVNGEEVAEEVGEEVVEEVERVDSVEALYQHGYSKLNQFQIEILEECIVKGGCGVSVPVGSGKTLLALVLGLHYLVQNEPNTNGRILVAANKTLISSWIVEIKKWFGDLLKYKVIHKTLLKKDWNTFVLEDDVKICLMQVDTLASIYKNAELEAKFTGTQFVVHRQRRGWAYGNARGANLGANQTIYHRPTNPFLAVTKGPEQIFSVRWNCLVIDECQTYTNIDTNWCCSLGAICSPHRFGLSGTLFDEPKTERILGYHVMLDIEGVPRNISDTEEFIRHRDFKGMNTTTVHRTTNLAFTPPKVNERIITHELTEPEMKVYLLMKQILLNIRDRAKEAHLALRMATGQAERELARNEFRRFSSYKMVVLLYLREAFVCPLLPITSVVIDSSDMKNRTELSEIIMDELRKVGLQNWLSKAESAKSSRITAVLEQLEKHRDEKIVVFACFKSFIDMLAHFMPDGRPIYRITATMSATRRGEVIEEFRKSTNGVFMATYQMCGQGLNLQFTSTICLVDFWWSAARTQQAIGRIFRQGQLATEINVYFFTSRTGIEKILFEKAKAKLAILEELKVGAITSQVPTVNMDHVIKMIGMADNTNLLKQIKYY